MPTKVAPDSAAPTGAAPPRRARLNSLTGLRYFGALAVVLVHVGSQFADSRSLTVATGYGYVGVTFFFLLSGYVLTWSYSSQPLTRFWWLRFSRIWPLNTALMIAWFTIVVEEVKVPDSFEQTAVLLMAQAWDPHQSIYFVGNFVSWSLSCEMFFYLLFPCAVLLVRRLGPRGVLVTAAATMAAQLLTPLLMDGVVTSEQWHYLFYIFPPYRFGEFLLGMLAARATTLGLRIRTPGWTWGAAALGLLALTAGFTRFTLHTGEPVNRPLVAFLAIPFLVVLLLSSTATELRSGESWFGKRPLVRLGEWSFALYLVHEPLFQVTQRWGWWDDNVGGIAGAVGLVGFLVIATLLAAALHYVIERPAERLLRRVASMFPQRPALGAVAGSRP
ncbi:MAG TPA: acyltransferase [Pseudonocardia sp.]